MHAFFTFDHNFGIKVTQNVAQYSPLPIVTYPPAKLEVATSSSLESRMHLQENTFIDLDCRVKVTQIVAKYPLHHMTYASIKFEVATSNGFPRSRCIYKKIQYLMFDLDQWHSKFWSVPSTSCDQCTCKI